MKKTILLLIAAALPLLGYAEDDRYTIKDNAVVVEKVIPFTVPMSTASLAIRNHFATTLNNSNWTMKLAEEDNYVVKALTPQLVFFQMNLWYTRGRLTITVRLKEDRMKVVVLCDEIVVSATSSPETRHYNPVFAAPLSDEHDAWVTGTTKKVATQTFNELVDFMNAVIVDIHKAVITHNADDNW